MKLKKQLSKILIAGAFAAWGGVAHAVAITADIITVVDESGSMSGEHAWLSGMISSLDAALAATAGADPLSAQYGLVGYGGGSDHIAGHQHNVGGGQFGTAAQFGTATGSLLLNGGFEDGYSGMDTALGYTLRANAATNIILVTDEDRDNGTTTSDTYAAMKAALDNENALLNAVVNCQFTDGNGNRALGIDAAGNAYVADGAGGYTSSAGGTQTGSCSGTTKTDYVDLALAVGGAAWDLNLLRIGGVTADSFTSAFVNIKVGEIVIQQSSVPEPATLVLMGLGLAGLGFRKQRVQAPC